MLLPPLLPLLQLEGPQILDWPLVAITSLTADGSTPHLVLQAKRQMPPVKELQGVMKWSGEPLAVSSRTCTCSVEQDSLSRKKQHQGRARFASLQRGVHDKH